MAVLNFRPLTILINLILIIVPANSSKLNVPRVLLPIFNDFSTTFTLEATEGGCYKWSTTRNDIIQLTPLDEEPELQCSTKVVVSTVTKEAARNMAVVLAEDVHTKQMLRCDVMVDVIHDLLISTTTRELFMEEAPEDFEVKAFDDQGNEFSTLEGVEFDWNIVSLGPNKDTVLRYITFRDSPYETPHAIANLENEGKKGYSILLEGVKSGSAKVTVRLPYPEYKHVDTNEVQLMIVANLLITPPEVYVMQGDTVPFKIYFLKNGRMEEIVLPDLQYYLEAEDMEIGSSNKKTGNITALKEGDTRIVLRDRNVGVNDPLMKLPAANFHVVKPDYLVLNILPHRNWAVLVGDHHDIVADLYSSSDHKLYVGGSVNIYMEVSPEFLVNSRSPNGSWLTGYGIKSGIATVQASLDGVFNEKTGKVRFDKPVTAKADLMIYPRITITPSEVILPWDPLTRPKYDIDLIAKGGDGRFLWSSSDHSIGMVSQTGHVKTHSNGFFEVSAVMLRNHHNRQSTKFIILPPSRLEIVEFVMEAEVGAPVYLHIALYAEQEKDGTTIQLPFTKCQELPFHIKQSDAKFRQNKTAVLPPVGISCGNIAMTALDVGTSKVTVTYFQNGKALEDSVTVSAYKTLNRLEPKGEVVLAVGTSINLVFVGGPRPILGRLSDHQRIIVSEDESIALAYDITQFHIMPREDHSIVQVFCKKLGETDVKLMISNTPEVSNCKTKTSSIITRVTCGKPRKITLQPELRIADVDGCPMDLISGNVVVQSTKNIDIDVTVYDDCGNKFLNITSFYLDWKIAPAGSGVVLSNTGVFPRNITIGDVPVGNKFHQTLQPSLDKGSLVLNVTIRGYNPSVLHKHHVTAESPPFISAEDKGVDLPPITATLSLFLVEDTIVSPNLVTIFNHPGNRVTVPVKQGSGYFEMALSSDDIALIKYSESTKEIEISPLKSGELTIQLIDLCLVSRPATLIVNVVSVGIVRVEMPDKVEVGKCIPAIVRLYDENDNLMDSPEYGMIDLQPEFENKIANIQLAERSPTNPWGVGEVHFIITGVEIGETKLVFSVAGGDEEVTSAPIDLQVFEPLRLSPRNGSILVGSMIQLAIKGGPYPDTNVIFAVASSKIATVSEKGLIRGKSIGLTKITAQAVGIHPSTGQKVIYSEDTVEIQIVQLQALKIVSSLLRFKVGATVPFWCVGVPDISPMILGSLEDPPILFKWTVDDKLLVDLSGVFHPIGVFKKKTDRVAAKVLGLVPGKTRLFVNATVPGPTLNIQNIETVMLSAWIDIEVIQSFSFVFPKNFLGNSLLMAPFSEVQLETNMDSTSSKVTYFLPGDKAPSTELLADKSITSDIIVTVTPTGLLQSYGVLGHALLMATTTDEQGLKQYLSIVVEVKPIQYMNLKVIANWRIHSDSPLRTLPLGTEFQLKATFHDNIGNTFHGGPKHLKVRTSRCDLVKVTEGSEDASVWIYTKKEGNTMLKAWAEGIQKTADYVKINVEQSVRPILSRLTTGDVICLWTPVVTEYNAPGTWKSSDITLMHINPALDIGFVGNKEGVVILTHSLLQSAPIHIQIDPVSEIEILEDPNLILTNGIENSVVRVILVLQSQETIGIKTNNLIQGWRCRTDVRKLIRPHGFRCFIQFSNDTLPITIDQLFNVTNSWVPESGQYACKLINLGVSGMDISVLRTNLLLWASTEDGEITSKQLNIKFLPGVFTPPEITLAENVFTGEVTVIGLPEVLDQIEVYPADTSILYVSKGKSVNETSRKYEIQLVDYHWRLADIQEAMGIIISSPSTKQHLKVIVKVTGNLEKQLCSVGRSPVFLFLQNYKYAIAMAIAMMIIFFLTFYFYSNYMQPVVNVNVNPSRLLTPTQTFTPSQTSHRCAANLSANMTRITPTISPNTPNRSQTSCRFNCSCCGNTSGREPIYGDASSFYNSPEIRRNRRLN
ncbi:nucleoporin 210 [Leptinotarsa decemlineata]|uniref:nucleoporin 210 n=1 Tax=Leptinotarsa decemlineata TaxID=7539 RepID=UPI003D30C3D4